jgi:mRNA interferase MazF
MVIERGEIWWAELAAPRGSEPGFRRPVAIVQADAFNRSRLGTVVVVAITSNLDLAGAPGNVRLSRRESKLSRESVVNVSQVLTLDRRFLTGRVGRLPGPVVEAIAAGLRVVLSL